MNLKKRKIALSAATNKDLPLPNLLWDKILSMFNGYYNEFTHTKSKRQEKKYYTLMTHIGFEKREVSRGIESNEKNKEKIRSFFSNKNNDVKFVAKIIGSVKLINIIKTCFYGKKENKFLTSMNKEGIINEFVRLIQGGALHNSKMDQNIKNIMDNLKQAIHNNNFGNILMCDIEVPGDIILEILYYIPTNKQTLNNVCLINKNFHDLFIFSGLDIKINRNNVLSLPNTVLYFAKKILLDCESGIFYNQKKNYALLERIFVKESVAAEIGFLGMKTCTFDWLLKYLKVKNLIFDKVRKLKFNNISSGSAYLCNCSNTKTKCYGKLVEKIVTIDNDGAEIFPKLSNLKFIYDKLENIYSDINFINDTNILKRIREISFSAGSVCRLIDPHYEKGINLPSQKFFEEMKNLEILKIKGNVINPEVLNPVIDKVKFLAVTLFLCQQITQNIAIEPGHEHFLNFINKDFVNLQELKLKLCDTQFRNLSLLRLEKYCNLAKNLNNLFAKAKLQKLSVSVQSYKTIDFLNIEQHENILCLYNMNKGQGISKDYFSNKSIFFKVVCDKINVRCKTKSINNVLTIS